MNVLPINCAYGMGKNAMSPNFKAIVTGQTHSTGDEQETINGLDSGYFPISSSCYYETILHDYYELIDETPKSFRQSCPAFKEGYVLDYEDRTQSIEFYKKEVWNKLGVIPIKVSEWAKYTQNKAGMARKDIEYIEKILTRYNLKNLIK